MDKNRRMKENDQPDRLALADVPETFMIRVCSQWNKNKCAHDYPRIELTQH